MDIKKTNQPPRIIHGSGRPDPADMDEVLVLCRRNARLCDREFRLLRYYAQQATGFQPAQLTIYNATGIGENHLHAVRQSLKRMCLIDYVNTQYDHFIFLNWTVIIGYALLSEPLNVGGRGRTNFKE